MALTKTRPTSHRAMTSNKTSKRKRDPRVVTAFSLPSTMHAASIETAEEEHEGNLSAYLRHLIRKDQARRKS